MKKPIHAISRVVYCLFGLIIIIVSSCKKDAEIISSANIQNAQTSKVFGVITVNVGILPPVTQKSFIANGDTSITEFQVTASKLVLLRRMDFSAPVLIKASSISSIYSYQILNDTGNMTYYIDRYIKPGTGADLFMKLYYNNVTQSNSSSTARVMLTHLTYISLNDNIEHDIYMDSSVKSAPMCLVNNKPDIHFQNPASAALSNGYKEIMEVQLSGDTNWTLNALPVFIYAPVGYNGSISKTKLIVQKKNQTVITNSDSLTVPKSSTGSTVIHFPNGVKHIAGQTDTLKIYAPVNGSYVSFITTMNPYNALVWTDALSTKINGTLNNQYFKDDTNFSSFFYQQ